MTASYLMLLSALCISIHFVFIAKILEKEEVPHPSKILSQTHLMAFLMLSLYLVAFYKKDSTTLLPIGKQWLLFFVAAGSALVAKLLQYPGYVAMDIGLMSVFSALTPIFAIVFGYFFLSEVPSTLALLGIALTTVGVYLVYCQQIYKKYWVPLGTLLQNEAAILALLSSIPPALSVIFVKKTVLLWNPWFYAPFHLLFIGLGSALFFGYFRKDKFDFAAFLDKRVLGASLFLAGAQITATLASLYTQASHVSALSRLSIFFQTFFAYFIFHKKENFLLRMLLCGLIFVGFVMLSFAKAK